MGKWTSNKNPTKQQDKKKTITILAILFSALTLIIIVLLILIFSKPKKQIYEVSYDHTSITATTSLTGRTLSYQEVLDSDSYRLDLSISTNSDTATIGAFGVEDTYLFKASSLAGNRDIAITITLFDLKNNDYLLASNVKIKYEVYLGESNDSKELLNNYQLESSNYENRIAYSSGGDIYLYSFSASFQINKK